MVESPTANFLADGWDTDGLPAHLIADVPQTVPVTTYPPGREPVVEQVPIERDGKVLLLKDRVGGWAPGVADGWTPTRFER